MTETTVSATELLAYLLTQYERAVSIHAQVRMDTDEDRRLHADAITALRRAGEPVARYLDRAARKPLTAADVPGGQGPASLHITSSGGRAALWFKADGGTLHFIRWAAGPGDTPPARALWDHLAATIPHVTTKET